MASVAGSADGFLSRAVTEKVAEAMEALRMGARASLIGRSPLVKAWWGRSLTGPWSGWTSW